ncbi:MAG TPA: hypothetical protein DD624_06165, partial [Alphaproteobacteria bacterium]|nr:hypothetical protein [Alphaproteobacteria bacterium]
KEAISYYFTTGSSGKGAGDSIVTGGMESLETVEKPYAMPFVGFDGSSEFPDFSEPREILIKKEKEAFDRVRIALEEAMMSDPDLLELHDSLVVTEVKDGLQIQLIDQLNKPIFASGTAKMTPNGARLSKLLARVLKQLPNTMRIEGHTDAVPYASANKSYTNWELSSDRALAVRRMLIAMGIADSRIVGVEGRASAEPYLAEDPKAPQNRRISLVLQSAYGEKE